MSSGAFITGQPGLTGQRRTKNPQYKGVGLTREEHIIPMTERDFARLGEWSLVGVGSISLLSWSTGTLVGLIVQMKLSGPMDKLPPEAQSVYVIGLWVFGALGFVSGVVALLCFIRRKNEAEAIRSQCGLPRRGFMDWLRGN